MHVVRRVLEEVQVVGRLDGEYEWFWSFVKTRDVVGVEVRERAQEGLILALERESRPA